MRLPSVCLQSLNLFGKRLINGHKRRESERAGRTSAAAPLNSDRREKPMLPGPSTVLSSLMRGSPWKVAPKPFMPLTCEEVQQRNSSARNDRFSRFHFLISQRM